MNKVDQWCKYNRTYIQIQRNPHMRKAMKNDPGVKFMQHGWWVVFVIITMIGVIGRM